VPEAKGRRNSRKAVSDGQGTSQEYKRFESLVRRIVRVPKKDIDAEREREKKRA
jgi:hypothetical protein